MATILLTSALATLAPSLAAVDEPQHAVDPDPVITGSGYYATYCAVCHGSTGLGDGPLAPGLTQPPPDITRLRFNAGGIFPRERIAAAIDGRDMTMFHGQREMPVWGDVFKRHRGAQGEQRVRERIERLVDYLETLQRD